jgi:ferredoxin
MHQETISKNVLLIFNRDIMYNPIIYRVTKDYQILFNVLEAKILPRQEGRLILQLEGKQELLEQAIEYMQKEQVKVEVLANRIKRDTDKCIHCGACTGVCKTGALWMDKDDMRVHFEPDLCVACGQCELACPVDAMSVASIDMDIL